MTSQSNIQQQPTEQQAIHEHLLLLGKLYSPDVCSALLARLIAEVDWCDDSFVICSRRFGIPRLQAWFADPGIRYNYSNNLLETQSWVDPLVTIRKDVQDITGHTFNSVLLTYYRNGQDHVSWHADDESELGDAPVIASLSLGATRQFQFRNKHDGRTEQLSLHNGDLLLMQPEFQSQWLHCVPIEPSIDQPRINLTFRWVVPPQ